MKISKKVRKCIDKSTILFYNEAINKRDKEKRKNDNNRKGGNSTESIIQSPF